MSGHFADPARIMPIIGQARSGRIRLAMIADNSAASLEAFVRANVKPGAALLTDGHSSCVSRYFACLRRGLG